MPISWLTALKVIPWGDVIEHAPTVLKGARRLLERQSASPAQAADADTVTDLATLQRQLAALRHQQASDMAQLTQTVAALAEQNTQLVEAVDVLRWRTRWLGAIVVLLGGGGLAWLIWGT